MAMIPLRLRKKSAGDLTLFARNMNKKLKANAALFPALPVATKDIDTHIAELEDAESDMLHGGTLETEIRDEKRTVLESDIRQLSLYVLQVSQGNAVIIRKAGFPIQLNRTAPASSLDMPSVVKASSTISGTVDLKWGKVAKARHYVVEMGDDPATDLWQNAAHNTHTKASISGLKKAKIYYFRVAALGVKGVQSGWSQTVSVVVS